MSTWLTALPVEEQGCYFDKDDWADLMAAVPQYASGGAARIPPGVVTLSVCSESGLLTTGATCPEPIQEYFLQDLVPVDTCPLHQQQGQFEKIWDGIKGIFKKE